LLTRGSQMALNRRIEADSRSLMETPLRNTICG
jgi:hypothetical protein